eukprot:scaffold54835_cov60-Phaeocystis_antarctica.AAC.2
MNERADELAAQGAQGLRRRDDAIYVPLDGPRLPADTPLTGRCHHAIRLDDGSEHGFGEAAPR